MSRNLERIGQVAASTVLSRILGVVRDALAVRVFGAGELHSAFWTAFTLPNLFRRLLGEGALTGAMVPVLSAELERGGRPAAFRLMNEVFGWLLLLSGSIVALGMALLALAPSWPGFDPRWARVADLAFLLLPYLVFACTAAIQAACLNVLGRFAAPALAPVWLNLSMILSLNALGIWIAQTQEGRMLWLCGGVLFGGALQLGLPAVDLWRAGWRPALRLSLGPGTREIAALMLPSLAGTAIYQVNLAASRFLAFDLNDAATTLLFLAGRLMELPIGVFSVAVATVVFPDMARALARGDREHFRRAYAEGARLTLAITVPAAAGLAVLALPLGRVLFQRGAFTATDVAALVPVLLAYLASLPSYSFVLQLTRASHADRDMRTPVRAAAVGFVANVLLSLLLPRWLGTPGLAWATTCSMLLQHALLRLWIRRRLPEVRVAGIAADALRVVLAAAGMAGAVGLLWWGWERGLGAGFAATLAGIVLAVVFGAAVYGSLLWSLRFTGRERVLEAVRRKLGIMDR